MLIPQQGPTRLAIRQGLLAIRDAKAEGFAARRAACRLGTRLKPSFPASG